MRLDATGLDATKAMAAIGGAVALASAVSHGFSSAVRHRPSREVTGAAVFGWRLFAMRTGYLSVQATGEGRKRWSLLPSRY
jgi:hypothetical protein